MVNGIDPVLGNHLVVAKEASASLNSTAKHCRFLTSAHWEDAWGCLPLTSTVPKETPWRLTLGKAKKLGDWNAGSLLFVEFCVPISAFCLLRAFFTVINTFTDPILHFMIAHQHFCICCLDCYACYVNFITKETYIPVDITKLASERWAANKLSCLESVWTWFAGTCLSACHMSSVSSKMKVLTSPSECCFGETEKTLSYFTEQISDSNLSSTIDKVLSC